MFLLQQPTNPQYPNDLSYILPSPNASIQTIAIGHETKERWQIRIWNPSNAQLHLFTFFSPVHVLLVLMIKMDDFGLWTCIVLNLFLVLYSSIDVTKTHLIVGLFKDAIRDQKIVSGQVLNEFTHGFVNKLPPFLKKSHKGVQADDSSLIRS
jgi:hypothetical protein